MKLTLGRTSRRPGRTRAKTTSSRRRAAFSDFARPFELLKPGSSRPNGVESWLVHFRWAPSCWPREVRETHERNGLPQEHASAAPSEVFSGWTRSRPCWCRGWGC